MRLTLNRRIRQKKGWEAFDGRRGWFRLEVLRRVPYALFVGLGVLHLARDA